MNSKVVYLTAFVLICSWWVAGSTAHAQQWMRTAGPEGGTITGFVTVGDTIFATQGDYGLSDVYRSTDQGKNWTSVAPNLVGTGPIGGLAVNSNSHEIYIGSLGGLFVSRDGGNTWDSITPGVKGYRITTISATGSSLFAGASGEGLFRSTDDGNSWTQSTFLSGHPNAFHNVLRSGATLFLSTQGQGIYRSENDGISWTPSSDTISGDNLYIDPLYALNGMLYAGTVRGLYRSSDNGIHWRMLSIPASQAVALTSNGNTLYLNAGYEGVFSSIDAGESWKPVGDSLPQNNNLKGIAFQKGVLLIGTDRLGVFRMDTANGHWTNSSRGINNTTALSLNFIAPKGGIPRLFAGTNDADFGYGWMSLDQGATWKVTGNLTSRGVHTFTANKGVLFAGTDGMGIYRSTDNGDNWEAAPNQINGATYINAFAVTPNALLAGSSGFGTGIVRSLDGGETWLPANTAQTFAPNVQALYYDSVSGKCFAANGYGFGVSTDEGLNWGVSNSLLDSTECYCVLRIGKNLMVGTWKGLYYSKDNGINWQLATSGLPSGVVSALTKFPQGVFAAVGSSVYKSLDEGITWTLYRDALPTSIKIFSLAADHQWVYAGTNGLGVWRAPLDPIEEVRKTGATSSNMSISYGDKQVILHLSSTPSASVRISIYNANGSLIRTLESSAAQQMSISTASYPVGVYYMEVWTNERSSRASFIVLPD